MKSNHTLVALIASTLLLLAGLSGCNSKSAMPFTWALTGTVWTFTELEGHPVGGDRLPTLQLEPNGSRINGTGGFVNRITGTYQTTATGLSFGAVAATRMAGPERQMKTEEQFVRLLQSVTGCRLTGNRIELLAGETVVARGQATPATPFPPQQ